MANNTRPVYAGGIQIGGGARVTVQSMTNTRTADVDATVAQMQRLIAAGCDIIRFAVLDKRDAEAVRDIRDRIKSPIVADIHFDHKLAIECIENGVDKLRINPGNIGAEQRVRAVADCAAAHGVPIRVGVNAGSLERAMLEKYGGPTAEALAQSAMGHVRLLEKEGFKGGIVISAKASSVPVTVETYRLLSRMSDYPLHVGVTEAGSGGFGVVKSAAGIGTLLLEGIGDTIRVSLTGDPVQEVRAGIEILKAVGLRREGVEVISCPTCGRCRNIAAHGALAERVETEFAGVVKPLRVAVMGCAVNGPGEAREADIGIAFGETNAVIFEHGAQTATGMLPGVADEFIARIRALLD